ncbi:hypothetical protein XELAEV_18016219mg [Xenopus laevis]|uniref:Uncharacterized protein n=1 Tax=Xenopus laevis TaxID=8355 RepID=A0A974HWQ3_XENLA|nr:hypothetical protein XELAEV_18016219mg [Xenopus laevis]
MDNASTVNRYLTKVGRSSQKTGKLISVAFADKFLNSSFPDSGVCTRLKAKNKNYEKTMHFRSLWKQLG